MRRRRFVFFVVSTQRKPLSTEAIAYHDALTLARRLAITGSAHGDDRWPPPLDRAMDEVGGWAEDGSA